MIDYLRQEIPLRSREVIIPFFPEKGEMVLVQGDDGGEPWRGHIQNVDTRNKTCQLHFYVETYPGSRCYQREHTGHHALETIHWDSIVDKANGSWNRKEWTRS